MKTVSTLNVDSYRKLVQNYLDLHMYTSALFWADKVVALTGNPRDIYWLAQCMYLLKEYHRAVHLLRSRNLEKAYILCNYLTVKCLLEANELNEALKVINLLDIDTLVHTADAFLFDDKPKNQVYSSVLYLKGKVLESMDNRGLAAQCYKQALHHDVHCFEAFDALIKYQMLTAVEEQELINSLPINEQCLIDDGEIVRTLYESKLKKYHTPTLPSRNESKIFAEISPLLLTTIKVPQILSVIGATPSSVSTPNVTRNNDKNLMKNEIKKSKSSEMDLEVADEKIILKLKDSLDIHVSQAERLYYNCDFQQCAELTEAILKQDPYHTSCLPIHISCQVELKQSRKLFLLAHNLVDLYPNLAISWFAVGCYYYIIGKSDYSRRYLAKATCLDRLFGPAWLAYGHSFAIENEHDQAMAAYFKASQLMKGCHLPLLYIGLECGLTNNVRLAEKFFQQAQAIAPDDPFLMHERGVMAFQNNDFKIAEKYFKDALNRVKKIKKGLIPHLWVPLLNNLGHVCRKLKKYEESMDYHQEALLLSPQNASIYSAIAYVYALMGQTDESADWFHKALGFKRDHLFSSTMLNYVIEQLSEEKPPYLGAPLGIPKFIAPERTLSKSNDSELEEINSLSHSNNDVPDMSMSIEMEMSDASGMIRE